METVEDVEAELILKAAGIDNYATMPKSERQQVINALKNSTQEQNAFVSSLHTEEKTAAVDKCFSLSRSEKQEITDVLNKSTHEQNTSCSSLYTQKRSNAVCSQEESEEIYKSITSPNLIGKKTFDSSSNHGNLNHSFGDKEVSKPQASTTITNASAAAKPGSSRSHRPENRSVPGTAVPVRDIEPNSNNTDHAKQNQPNYWMEAKSKENGVSRRRSLALPKEEVKTEEPEGNKGKDSLNNSVDYSKNRDSPEFSEEEQGLMPLMHRLFEERNSASLFSKTSLPPLSLPREKWVGEVGQYFFAKKASRIRAEARQAKWVTLSERNISLVSLENAMIRNSPSPKKDDGSSSFTEKRNMDNEQSPKATTASPENANESSTNDAVVENSPNRDSVNLDTGDNTVIASPDTSKKTGTYPPENLPEGEQTRKKSQRNRGKQGRRNNRGGIHKSASTSFNEDNSNSPPAKNNEREYEHDSANFPPMTGSSGSPRTEQEMASCPLCNELFPQMRVNDHAWSCGKLVKEDVKQVADGNENEMDSDTTEIEPKKTFSIEDQSDSDEDFVIRKLPPSAARKRPIFHSDDEERLPKTPRK